MELSIFLGLYLALKALRLFGRLPSAGGRARRASGRRSDVDFCLEDRRNRRFLVVWLINRYNMYSHFGETSLFSQFEMPSDSTATNNRLKVNLEIKPARE